MDQGTPSRRGHLWHPEGSSRCRLSQAYLTRRAGADERARARARARAADDGADDAREGGRASAGERERERGQASEGGHERERETTSA